MNRTPTEQLIRRLADTPPPPRLSMLTVAAPMLGAAGVAVGLFLLLAGPRADLLAALSDPGILAKLVLPVALAVPALLLALRSARPGTPLSLWVLGVPAVAALLLFLTRLVQTPPDLIAPAIMGSSAAACLLSITTLSVPAIALGLILFRRGAALRPALTGALIGLAASAGVTAGYALHCNEDSPLFFTIWYGLAIILCTAAGAAAGRSLLRW